MDLRSNEMVCTMRACLAQLVECKALNLVVVGLNPMVAVYFLKLLSDSIIIQTLSYIIIYFLNLENDAVDLKSNLMVCTTWAV